MTAVRVRTSTPDDLGFIREMGYEAAFWRPDRPRPPIDEALADPHLARYLDGWGRPGDGAVIAEDAGDRVGAAWFRLFDADEPGYGFIDESIPELSIGVRRDRRREGIGGALLSALIELARKEGHSALSLSVEVANPAVSLYERHGFVRAGGHVDAWMMRLDLAQRG